jgi:Ca2+-binding EF-hand superfamily protein
VRPHFGWLAAWFILAGGAYADDGGSLLSAVGRHQTAPMNAIIFAPAGPVFLRLQVQVDGQSINRFRERAVAQWFRQLDHNRDGFLDKTEIAPFLKALGEQAEAGARMTWDGVDTDPADGKVSPREFRVFVDRQLGPPLALSVRTKTDGEVDASLFRHLDLNGDGVLSVDELRNARTALAPLDADDDETISVAELMAASQKRGPVDQVTSPNSQPREMQTQAGLGRPKSDWLPLMFLGPDTSAASLAEALLREYGAATTRIGERRLPVAALGFSSTDTRRFDRGNAAGLGARDLAQLLVETPPQIELGIQLFDQQHGQPRVSVAPVDRSLAFEWQQPSAETGTLVVNGLKGALSAKRTRGSTGDMSSFYVLRFNIVDQDKNNYLDRQEFAALGLEGVDFATVDANGDGQIVQAELAGYLKRKANVYCNQVVIAIWDESQSIFDCLDTRPDGRLSPRELNAAADRLRALDRNQDGRLSLGELRTQFRLEAEVKRPPSPRPVIQTAAPRQQSSVPAPRDRGPEWFRRMDRNFDGDVSRREFLGPRGRFDQLDTDHDGLLSPEEAERAK